MKTIFLTVYHPYASRNVLSNGAVLALADKPGVRIIIFCPQNKKEFFSKNYGRANVIVEAIDNELVTFRSLANQFFDRWTIYMLPTFTISLRMKEDLYRRRKNFKSLIVYRMERLLFWLGRIKLWRHLVRLLDYYVTNKKFLDYYLEKYQPNCLWVTDVFSPQETMFMAACRAQKIPITAMVRSWDGTTNKRLIRILPDKLVVSNPLIRQEAIYLHDVPAADIEIVGMPQYDLYFEFLTKFKTLSVENIRQRRQSFFEKMGLDPNKRLILVAPAGSFLTNIDWQILEIIKQAQMVGNLPTDIQFMVRQHPSLPSNFSRFSGGKNFIIESPGVHLPMTNDRMTEMDQSEISHLCDSLYFSELLVQFSSTIGVDACVFNRPQIMVAFDGWETKPYIDSVKRYHDEINMKHFISLGPAIVVNTSEELISGMNKYLNNPALDQAGRERAVREIIYKFDGQSHQRLADFIFGESGLDDAEV